MFDAEEDCEDWNSLNTDDVELCGASTTMKHKWNDVSDSHRSSSTLNKCCRNIIIHIDVDCFYAQVEMIRNPLLQSKPIGVYQKSYLATSNYMARELGVKKGMSVKAAKEACTDLVLINGEDLTPYRELSYRITELIKNKYTSLVERLGFDENYIDVTALVDGRVAKGDCDTFEDVVGHVYSPVMTTDSSSTSPCSCGCQHRLAIGSHIAQEVRDDIRTQLGLNTCAGVAHNKLLAKLIGSTHKPNQQTVIYPRYAQEFMSSLDSVQKITGVGSSTAGKLNSIAITSVVQLQHCSRADLCSVMDRKLADQLMALSHGIDTSTVTASGPPQSISEEEACKVLTGVNELDQKLDQLLTSLLSRVRADGRAPQTLKVTIRQSPPAATHWGRECRQSSVSPHMFQDNSEGSGSDVVRGKLKKLTWSLLDKLIPDKTSFALTLVGVGVSKFTPHRSHSQQQQIVRVNEAAAAPQAVSIRTLFEKQQQQTTQAAYQGHGDKMDGDIEGLQYGNNADRLAGDGLHEENAVASTSLCEPSKTTELDEVKIAKLASPQKCVRRKAALPAEINPDVFSELPEDVQNEILEHYDKQTTSHVREPILCPQRQHTPLASVTGKKKRKHVPTSATVTNITKYFRKLE